MQLNDAHPHGEISRGCAVLKGVKVIVYDRTWLLRLSVTGQFHSLKSPAVGERVARVFGGGTIAIAEVPGESGHLPVPVAAQIGERAREATVHELANPAVGAEPPPSSGPLESLPHAIAVLSTNGAHHRYSDRIGKKAPARMLEENGMVEAAAYSPGRWSGPPTVLRRRATAVPSESVRHFTGTTVACAVKTMSLQSGSF